MKLNQDPNSFNFESVFNKLSVFFTFFKIHDILIRDYTSQFQSYCIFLGDNTLRIWDISAPPHAQQTIRAHDGEVLTCDWAKYDPVSTKLIEIELMHT